MNCKKCHRKLVKINNFILNHICRPLTIDIQPERLNPETFDRILIAISDNTIGMMERGCDSLTSMET